MNNTKYLRLTQWEDTDRVEREYFNRDSQRLDNALSAIARTYHNTLLTNYISHSARPNPYDIQYNGFSDASLLDTSLTTAGVYTSGNCCLTYEESASLTRGVNAFTKTIQSNISTYNIVYSVPTTALGEVYIKGIQLNISASIEATISIAVKTSSATLMTITKAKVKEPQTISFTSSDLQAVRCAPSTTLTFTVTSTTSGATFSLYTADTSTDVYSKVLFVNSQSAEVVSSELGKIHEISSRAMVHCTLSTNLGSMPDITASLLDSSGTEHPLEPLSAYPMSASGYYGICFAGTMPGGPVRLKLSMSASENEIVRIHSYSVLPY